MATYAIADIHGNILGLKDVLDKCSFENSDTLINLGDVCDGGRRTKDVIERLLKIPNHILCAGNHDTWALNWMKTGDEYPAWWHQGGMNTAESYGFDHKMVPKSHIDFLEFVLPYYVDKQNRVYVHGGFDPLSPISGQSIDILTWDRSLFLNYAPKYIIEEFNHVFVGHTSTEFVKSSVPVTYNNLTALDCGGGWNGKPTIMDVDTFEFWQSDISANKQNAINSVLDQRW